MLSFSRLFSGFLFLFCSISFAFPLHASSITLGHIQCWPRKKSQKSGRLNIIWGNHCGGGRSCSQSFGVEFQFKGKWRGANFGWSTYPHRSKRFRIQVKGCRLRKKQYFFYSIKRWKKLIFQMELVPKGRAYKLRLYIARKRPIDTKGWLHGLRCKIDYRAFSAHQRCKKNSFPRKP